METQIKLIGVLSIALALLHVVFPRYFNWKSELQSLSLINRQMMIIHTFFIGVVLMLAGVLCLSSAGELVNTDLGKKISLGFGVFWLTRLIIQFFGYSPKLWRGKVFETCMHVVFSLVWTYLTFVFLATYFN